MAAVFLASYAAALGIALAPRILVDDAAITLRYAERLANGAGFTYNDHERVLGASNALFTLLLAGLVRVGLAPEAAARALGLVLFVASVLAAARLTARLASPAAGLLAGALLATDETFRSLALSGMESGAAVLFGLLVVDALVRGRDGRAGVLLGLALWNKLDAAALAVAVAAACLLVARRFPSRTAAIALLILVPWSAFAFLYFGSPIPHSLAAKWSEPAASFAPQRWVLGFLAGRAPHLLGAVACLGLSPAGSAERLAGVALLGWVTLHGLACALLNLGAPFSWYLTVLIPGPLILVCALVRRRRALALLLVAAGSLEPVTAAARDAFAGHPIRPQEAFDADRRLAGAFLDRYAGPAEVVESGYGWVAFESHRPFNDGSNLNSVRWLEPVAYLVDHGVPHDRGSHPPAVPEGYVPLASFDLASQLFPGYTWFTVFGRPDSRLARDGGRYLVFRLSDLPPWREGGSAPGQPGARLIGRDLEAPPPSQAKLVVPAGKQRVRLVFTPWVAGSGDQGDVTFEVRSDSKLVWRGSPASGGGSAPVHVDLGVAGASDALEVSLLTEGRAGARAAWRDVRLIVGDAEPELARLGDPQLIEAWLRYH